MYASTWICAKEVSMEEEDVRQGLRKVYGSVEQLKI